ncbi:histidine phosphatase family protein [Amylibacter sp. SFDW26]|uniref:histidine phosphatase family protein n=1 Tax=Amylibacter sp. SFDW26 TaxID=2652722 RepID=UPI0012626506|nr:histidine phosphatase family protein [Amylibacter sp. SFDW26]KAB7613865.1 histidine phosphatase family protein [Amylibacter sp. SFDW26]
MPSFPDLYILRHGQTTWNVAGRFQGRMNSPLTELGKDQAKRQNEIALSIACKPLQAFVSPQPRALQTAEIALDGIIAPQIDDRLQEIAFGDWEGLTHVELEDKITSPFEDSLWFYDSPKGEDFTTICDRVMSFLTDINAPAFIITHGVTSLILRGLWLGLDKEQLSKLPREQGCIYHLSNDVETCLR